VGNPETLPVKRIPKDTLQQVGASPFEADLLQFLSHVLTHSDPSWFSSDGDGSGAWAVSQKWFGIITPRENLTLQAAEALRVLRERTSSLGEPDDWPCLPSYYTAVLVSWWDPEQSKRAYDFFKSRKAWPIAGMMGWDDSKARDWLSLASKATRLPWWGWLLWGLGLVASVATLWLAFRTDKKKGKRKK